VINALTDISGLSSLPLYGAIGLIVVIRKGDPLGGGRRKAEDMFDIEEDDDDFLD
jgi:hypothetical protein